MHDSQLAHSRLKPVPAILYYAFEGTGVQCQRRSDAEQLFT